MILAEQGRPCLLVPTIRAGANFFSADALFNLCYFCVSFTTTLLQTLHLKCIISVVLIALLHIFLSPEPYLFHLFDFVVFYIESTLLCYLHIKCLISIMLIVLLLVCIFYLQDLIHSIFFDFVTSYTKY